MNGAVPILFLYAFVVWTGTNLPLPLPFFTDTIRRAALLAEGLDVVTNPPTFLLTLLEPLR
jgi:hypothetical protein